MLTIDARSSTLLVVDFQVKLMPAISQGAAAVANARRLIDAAARTPKENAVTWR